MGPSWSSRREHFSKSGLTVAIYIFDPEQFDIHHGVVHFINGIVITWCLKKLEIGTMTNQTLLNSWHHVFTLETSRNLGADNCADCLEEVSSNLVHIYIQKVHKYIRDSKDCFLKYSPKATFACPCSIYKILVGHFNAIKHKDHQVTATVWQSWLINPTSFVYWWLWYLHSICPYGAVFIYKSRNLIC